MPLANRACVGRMQVALNALELAVNAALSAPPSTNGVGAGAATVTAAAAATAVKVTVDGVKQALQKTHVLCECRLLRPCYVTPS